MLFVGHSELGTDRQPLIVLILQYAQEKKEASVAASAMLRCGEHAGVGNSYSCGWACSVAAAEFPGFFPYRDLNREISADSPAKFLGSLTGVPVSVSIGN